MRASRLKNSSEIFSLRKAFRSANERYVVVVELSAQENLRASYEWGCRVWGKKEAQRWLRKLRTAITKQLSLVPKGFPIAPENNEFSEEIRQVIVGRYRVLFTIRRTKVHVLHVRGPYVE